MSEKVEQVARAIFERHTEDLVAWEDAKEWEREEYQELAVAAIKAMRVPTREMVNAAWYGVGSNGPLVQESSISHSTEREDLSLDTAYEVWQAMCDAALKP